MPIVVRLLTGLCALILLAWVCLTVYAYWPGGIDEVPARSLAGPDDKFADVGGLDIRYRTFGTPAPDKPTLVLIHGFGNSLQSFRRLAPLLANDYYVVTLDLPGFGLSSKPADFDYRQPNQARVVGDFIRALGLERVVIGGHSLGGSIALHVALQEPAIIGLVVMNPGIINTGVPAITRYLPFPFPRLSAKQFGNRAFRERFLKTSFIDPDIVTEEVMDNLQLAPRSAGYLAGTTAMMGQYEAATEAALLPDVEVPVVIVWGERDRNKDAEELAQLRNGFDDDTLILAPDAGHYVHEESPQQVADGLIAAKPLWFGQRLTQDPPD